MSNKSKTYSEPLRRLRLANEISQEELAEEVGVSRATINKYENNGMTYEKYIDVEKALTKLIADKGGLDEDCGACNL